MCKDRCPHGNIVNPCRVCNMQPLGKPIIRHAPMLCILPIFLFKWCCRRPMHRCKIIQMMQCTICGRVDKVMVDWQVAVCYCCGRQESIVPDQIEGY